MNVKPGTRVRVFAGDGKTPPTREQIREIGAETMRHILTVRALLLGCIGTLVDCANDHDCSKLQPPEDVAYAIFTSRLEGVTYGSKEYRTCLREMGPALQHHYRHNRHHPEFHKDGIRGMDLFDLIEMLCDWKAATLRHLDGNMERSLKINAKRFQMPPALVRLLVNTLPRLERLAARAQVSASYPRIAGATR